MGDSKRTRRAMGQLTVGDGTKPADQEPRQAGIPVGMERALFAAAVDPVFREELLADRQGAVVSRGFTLTDSELAMLRVIPEVQLRAFIDGMDTSADNLERRSFLQAVAAGAVTVTAGGAVAGCSDDDDLPPKDGGPSRDTTGIRPDMPATRGIQPDMPAKAKDGGTVDKAVVPDSGSGSYGIRPKG